MKKQEEDSKAQALASRSLAMSATPVPKKRIRSKLTPLAVEQKTPSTATPDAKNPKVEVDCKRSLFRYLFAIIIYDHELQPLDLINKRTPMLRCGNGRDTASTFEEDERDVDGLGCIYASNGSNPCCRYRWLCS